MDNSPLLIQLDDEFNVELIDKEYSCQEQKQKQNQAKGSNNINTNYNPKLQSRKKLRLKSQVLLRKNKNSSVYSEEEEEEEEEIVEDEEEKDGSQLVNTTNTTTNNNSQQQRQKEQYRQNKNKIVNNCDNKEFLKNPVSSIDSHVLNNNQKPISINNHNSNNNNNNNNNNNKNISSSTMSLFKAFTRRNSNQSKHKKFNDNWINGNRDPVVEGVTFYVKFLGSVLTAGAGAEQAAEATKTVIQMVKAGKKTSRVGLTVSSSGITLLDGNSGEVSSRISIYDIAHCSADANYPNAFSFIATNKNETNECYCFASRKRKMAQQVTLTIAESFNLAFEIWQNSSGELDNKSHHDNSTSTHLQHLDWVHFEEESDDNTDLELTRINDHFENINLRTYRRHDSLEDPPPHRNHHHHHHHHQDLLICLH